MCGNADHTEISDGTKQGISFLPRDKEMWKQLNSEATQELRATEGQIKLRKQITGYATAHFLFFYLAAIVAAIVSFVGLRLYNIRFAYPQLYAWWHDDKHGYRSSTSAGKPVGFNGRRYAPDTIALSVTYPSLAQKLNFLGEAYLPQNSAFFLLDMINIFGDRINGYAWAGVDQPRKMSDFCVHVGATPTAAQQDQCWKQWSQADNPFYPLFSSCSQLVNSDMWADFQTQPAGDTSTILYLLFHGGLCRYAYAYKDDTPFIIMKRLFDTMWLPVQQPPNCGPLIAEAKAIAAMNGICGFLGFIAAVAVCVVQPELSPAFLAFAAGAGIGGLATIGGAVANGIKSVKEAKKHCTNVYKSENTAELYNACKLDALTYDASSSTCATEMQKAKTWLEANTNWGAYTPGSTTIKQFDCN